MSIFLACRSFGAGLLILNPTSPDGRLLLPKPRPVSLRPGQALFSRRSRCHWKGIVQVLKVSPSPLPPYIQCTASLIHNSVSIIFLLIDTFYWIKASKLTVVPSEKLCTVYLKVHCFLRRLAVEGLLKGRLCNCKNLYWNVTIINAATNVLWGIILFRSCFFAGHLFITGARSLS